MRITTNMIMRNYGNHLSNTVGGLESARKQVESGRRFAWSYEDPSAAAKGAVLDRRYARNADYLDVTKESQKWLDAQEGVLMDINKAAQNIDENFSTAAMDDPKGDVGRSAYAANLRELQRSMVNSLNVKYGDAFVMAGNDGNNPPFKMEDGKVYYRNIDVDCESPARAEYSFEITSGNMIDGDKFTLTIDGTAETFIVKDDGTGDFTSSEVNDSEKMAEFIAGKLNETPNPDYTITAEGSKIVYKAKNTGPVGGGTGGPAAEPDDPAEPFELSVDCPRTEDQIKDDKNPVPHGIVSKGGMITEIEGSDGSEDYKTLKEYAQEAAYVDLGFGLTFDADGKVVSSSAFDTALPGIKAIGYGKDDDGLSNNLIVLTGQLAEVLEADTFDRDAYGELWTKFHEQYQDFANEFTTLGAKSQLLESTESRLTVEKDNIYEQYKDTIGIEEEEAITNYSWAQYAYNVALKIGTSIIGPSLLDFMN